MFRKYHNVKVKTLNNGTFDSRLEFHHFTELKLMEKAGKIKDLMRQVRIPLGKENAIKYVADFVFWDNSRDCFVVWDSKGVETKEFKVKRAWLLDDYTGFIFIQAKKNDFKEFKPSESAGWEKWLSSFIFDYKEKLEKSKRGVKNENRAEKYARNSHNAKM